MTRKRKRYSKAFKLETIELSRTSGKSDSQLEEELGLGRGCLYIGTQLERDGEQAFPGQGRLKPNDEYVRSLERKLAIVQQQPDILKKALAIPSNSLRTGFARSPRGISIHRRSLAWI